MQFDYSHHLVGLIARVQSAATRLAAADPDLRQAVADRSRRQAAMLSARLDGSPLSDDTVTRVDGGDVPALEEPATELGVGWARALNLERMETQEAAAVEYANLCRLADLEEELAPTCLSAPLDTLRRLHGIICQGLVDPGVIGSWRRTDQAIHDGAQGMVIYNAPGPDRIQPAMAELGQWLQRRTLVMPVAVIAGIAHERILEIQPFESGNGRVARVFARLILRAGGIDTHGAAVLEAQLTADATGYYAEVAATMRRAGDLSRWLERHTGALARALEQAADVLDPRPRPALPEPGRVIIAELLPGKTINLREYAVDAHVDLRAARDDLIAFARAGELVEVPGGGGLSYMRPVASSGAASPAAE